MEPIRLVWAGSIALLAAVVLVLTPPCGSSLLGFCEAGAAMLGGILILIGLPLLAGGIGMERGARRVGRAVALLGLAVGVLASLGVIATGLGLVVSPEPSILTVLAGVIGLMLFVWWMRGLLRGA